MRAGILEPLSFKGEICVTYQAFRYDGGLAQQCQRFTPENPKLGSRDIWRAVVRHRELTLV